MRAILDANVFVSAFLSRTGAPALLLDAWLAGRFELVACEAILSEVSKTVASAKLRERLDVEGALAFVDFVRERAELVPDPTGEPPVSSRDPSDDYLIALAARERATLISGDRDLLALAPGSPVFAPREFLALLGSGDPAGGSRT